MRRLMLGCFLAVTFSVPVMADTTSAFCFQTAFPIPMLPKPDICPGAPATNTPGSTFTLTERDFGASEVGVFFFNTTAVTAGDIVLCENGVPCNRGATKFWSDLLRIQNVEGPRMRVDFFSDGPSVDFERLRKTLSRNAQLIREPCCENEGETIIYIATTAFGSPLSPIFRTNTFVIESDPVPEPSTLLLMGSGLILLGRQLRRRKLNS